jgi:hypothetical protein
MAKAAKPQPQQQEAPEVKGPSLAERIRALQAEAEELVEREVRRIKAGDGARAPIDWIRLDVRTQTKGGACNCKCALALLEKGKK